MGESAQPQAVLAPLTEAALSLVTTVFTGQLWLGASAKSFRTDRDVAGGRQDRYSKTLPAIFGRKTRIEGDFDAGSRQGVECSISPNTCRDSTLEAEVPD
jgi:hypothetical protein